MLTAVKFNDQLPTRGAEIDNVFAYGMLVSKVDAFQSMGA
jgi:hypothetical protein